MSLCAIAADPVPEDRDEAAALWLIEELVFEAGPKSVQMVVPRLRRRFDVDGTAMAFLGAVAARNARSLPLELETDDPAFVMASALTELGVLGGEPAHSTCNRAGGSVVEHACVRMAQVGSPRRSEDGGWGRNVYPRASGALISLGAPAPPAADLFETLRRRRSRRGPSERGLKLPDLSCVLAFSERAEMVAPEGAGEISFRPVASGGATHAVEVGLLIRAVPGLADGLYRYEPFAHALEALPARAEDAARLADAAMRATAAAGREPSVFLCFMVDIPRIATKYADCAVALAYMDVGCILQQLYIVVEGLGLAGCAVGGSEAELAERLFARGPEQHFLGGFVIW